MRRLLKDRLRPPSCRLKNHYMTKRGAEKARVRIQDKHRWLLRVYDCDHCHEYHLSRFRVDGKPVPIVGQV